MNGWIYLFFFFMLVKVQIIWIWSKNGCAAFTYQLNKLFSTNCFCRFKHILFTSLTKAASFVNPNKVGESLYPLPPFQLVFPWKLRHGKSSNPGILQHSLNFRLNNVFFFSDPDPPIIDILYGWSGICEEFGYVVYVFFDNKIKLNHFLYRVIMLVHLISSLPLTKSLLVPYACFYRINWLYSFIIIWT